MSVELPALPLEEWEPTKDTLHLWSQIVGKIRQASSAPRNHWWHVPLYVDVRGLTTRRLHSPDGATFEIDFDFVDHRLVVRTSDGAVESFALADGLSVAEFDEKVHATLAGLGLDVAISEVPFGVPMTTPYPEDREHASYDRDAVERFWRILDWSDSVFEEFSGWYCGKTSPVHLFWHSFDLAVTRFGGARAPALDGVDGVTAEAYSHEVVSFGFWAGDKDIREPSYYAYAAPEPPGLRDTPLEPDDAFWSERDSRCSATTRCAPPRIRARRCSRFSRARTTRGQGCSAGTAPSSRRRGARFRRRVEERYERPPAGPKHRDERRRREQHRAAAGPRYALRVTRRRPAQQLVAAHEPRLAGVHDERSVRQLGERCVVEAALASVDALRVQPRVDVVCASADDLRQPNVVLAPALGARAVAGRHRRRVVEKEQLGVAARLQQRPPQPPAELEPARDPALHLPLPADLPAASCRQPRFP